MHCFSHKNIISIAYRLDIIIILIIAGTFRLRPEYSVILVQFLRVVHIKIISVGNASSKCRIFGFHLCAYYDFADHIFQYQDGSNIR